MNKSKSRRLASLAFVLLLLILSGGCKKKAPVAPAPPPPPPTHVTESLEEQFDKRVRDIYFDYDKSDIRDDAKPALSDAADFLKQHGGLRFSIEGHCDERGSEEYNLGLGDRRANAAKEFLLSQGLAASRINTVSYGEERPVCHEQNEDCYKRNRRAAFTMNP